MHSALEWDDLRYVLAVGRSGSLSGAARTLRVNHSTVFRRIGAIEQKLGVRLFDRRRDGYVPTAPGEAAVRMAEQLETDLVALERRLAVFLTLLEPVMILVMGAAVLLIVLAILLPIIEINQLVR